MPIFSVRHVTTYRYSVPVPFGEHRMMLRPREGFDQKLLDATLSIEPQPKDIRWTHDVFGNCVALAQFDVRAAELRFESNIRVEHLSSNLPDLQIDPRAIGYPFS